MKKKRKIAVRYTRPKRKGWMRNLVTQETFPVFKCDYYHFLPGHSLQYSDIAELWIDPIHFKGKKTTLKGIRQYPFHVWRGNHKGFYVKVDKKQFSQRVLHADAFPSRMRHLFCKVLDNLGVIKMMGKKKWLRKEKRSGNQ